MRKIFRKIVALTLALVLVTVGLCEVSATAYTLTEDYDGNNFTVYCNANIYKYGTDGSVFVDYKGTVLMETYCSVSVTYQYIMNVGNNAVVITDTKSDTKTYAITAAVSYYDSAIYQMVNATYTFEADVPCSYGTQRFRTDPITITFQA